EFSADFIEKQDWLDDDLKKNIKSVVSAHHGGAIQSEELRIISEQVIRADKLSVASEREPASTNDKAVVNMPLASIFSEITLENRRDDQLKMNHDLLSFPQTDIKNLNPFYPTAEEKLKIDHKKYKKVKNAMENDLKHIRGFSKDDINSIYYILQKHLKFVPSAAFKALPDIPLFDHLKVTAALALCIFRNPKEYKPFKIILGDLSGIQDFIFYHFAGAGNIADKSATRRLRGRSLLINLIVDSTVKYITEQLNLYDFCVMWKSGGLFLIIAPNIKGTDQKLHDINKEINTFLSKQLGRLYVYIVHENVREHDIIQFSETLERIYDKMNDNKQRKFVDFLKEDDFFFKSPCNIKRGCIICGIHDVEQQNEIKCETCRAIEDLGHASVKNNKYLLRSVLKSTKNVPGTMKEPDFQFIYGNTKIAYKFSNKPTESDDNDIDCFTINRFEITAHGKTRGYFLMGNHVPKFKDHIVDLSNLIIINENLEDRIIESSNENHDEKDSKKSKLALFKSDIDNLGIIFSRGIHINKSISRIVNLSFMLDLFFSVEINAIARKNNIYIVFSGGDDLTVAGRYDEIVQFSLELKERFNKWVGNNPFIHNSGGIIIIDEKFPLRRAILLAEEELEKSKDFNIKQNIKNADFKTMKNAITIFNFTMQWNEYQEQVKLAKEFHSLQKLEKIPADFSHYLLNLHKVNPYQDKTPKKNSIFVIPKPHLKYYLTKRWKDKNELNDMVNKISRKNTFVNIPVAVSLWCLDRKYKN
ncbi:MAG: type III-A CRISPR-associated protein Cas10/Csm1, partial [Promethearchaeota archaeon]